MILPTISTEQNNVVENLLTNNVVVDSVAGSGKTTTTLYIGKHFNNSKILLLTYNSKLKDETRNKVKLTELNNIEVHSYHSFCHKYYEKCFRDSIILEILNNNKNPLFLFNYDIIILDEAQDITELYYKLIYKIFQDNNNNKNNKICIFGDMKQCIYYFNGADERFIKFANILFNFNNLQWSKCNISESFRVTKEIASFINNCLLDENRIISNKQGIFKPRYIVCNTFADNIKINIPLLEVKYYLDLGYKPDDIFILAPSIRNNKTPIRILENSIKRELEINLFVPTNDDEKIDEDEIKNKLVFSTFHQVKGLERKVVIIFNFDYSYFEYYNQEAYHGKCPNEIYVACTRSLERLTLLHDHHNNYFPFMNIDQLKLCCDVEFKTDIKPLENLQNNNNDIKNISVTNLIRFVTLELINEFYNILEIKKINEKGTKLNIKIKLEDKENGIVESISEINGIAIPAFYEIFLKNSLNIVNILKRHYEEEKNNKFSLDNIDLHNIQHILYVSNCWISFMSGFINKIYQIKEYDWLSKENKEILLDRMKQLNISNNSIFEKKAKVIKIFNREINGYFDCYDKDNHTLYEFKCVNQLDNEHFIQLAIYMFMHMKEVNDFKEEQSKLIQKYETKAIYRTTDIKTVYNIGDRIKYNNRLNIGDITDVLDNKVKVNNKLILKSKITDIKLNKSICNNKIDSFKKKINDYSHKFKYILYNILTDEKYEISCDYNKLKDMIEKIIHERFIKKNDITDEEFLQKYQNIFNHSDISL